MRNGPIGTADVLPLSVHGPAGVLDLHVPSGASAADVASEYSRQARLPFIPLLYTPLGTPLSAEETLLEAGLTGGSVLVAVQPSGVAASRAVPRRPVDPGHPGRLQPATGPLSALWFSGAVAVALLAGWFASRLPDDSAARTTTLVVLLGAAVVAVLPLGPLAPHRVLAAPAFAGAAVFALAWSPAEARLPTILGVAALAAAVTAAVARSVDPHAEEGLRVWMIAGAVVFLVTGICALVGVEAHVVWALLLLLAMLSSRFVPILAVDVPDQYLLDLERLAVSAWSARERPTGRRGRIIVPRQAVVAVASAGRRMVTAACAAVLAVAVVSAYYLLRTTHIGVDQVGARCLVGLAGTSLLLAARSYRHLGARSLLRAAGLGCLLWLALVLFLAMDSTALTSVAVSAIVLGGLLVVVAVALGRGWRSAWWSRQAEVAEGLCGSFAIGASVVAVGIFRALWN